MVFPSDLEYLSAQVCQLDQACQSVQEFQSVTACQSALASALV